MARIRYDKNNKMECKKTNKKPTEIQDFKWPPESWNDQNETKVAKTNKQTKGYEEVLHNPTVWQNDVQHRQYVKMDTQNNFKSYLHGHGMFCLFLFFCPKEPSVLRGLIFPVFFHTSLGYILELQAKYSTFMTTTQNIYLLLYSHSVTLVYYGTFSRRWTDMNYLNKILIFVKLKVNAVRQLFCTVIQPVKMFLFIYYYLISLYLTTFSCFLNQHSSLLIFYFIFTNVVNISFVLSLAQNQEVVSVYPGRRENAFCFSCELVKHGNISR